MSELNVELQAIAAVVAALDGLDEDVQARVLNWAAAKYKVTTPLLVGVDPQSVSSALKPTSDFTEFVDLYDAVDPSTTAEKILTGAYWLQVIKAEPSWQSSQVNSILKDTGNGVEGIAHAFERAQATKPALVRQVVKSGKSRQARKTHKLTTAGIKLIAEKIGVVSTPNVEE